MEKIYSVHEKNYYEFTLHVSTEQFDTTNKVPFALMAQWVHVC